jgi:hypothetical protein
MFYNVSFLLSKQKNSLVQSPSPLRLKYFPILIYIFCCEFLTNLMVALGHVSVLGTIFWRHYISPQSEASMYLANYRLQISFFCFLIHTPPYQDEIKI